MATGISVQLPLDSPYITMVKMARITNKSLSPSTILVWFENQSFISVPEELNPARVS